MVWLVRVPELPATGVEWMLAGVGEVVSGQGTLAELQAVLARRDPRQPVVLVLPVSSALVASVTVPVRNPRQLQQMLPFLVEEMLAADIESLHFVAGQRLAGGRIQVVAMERALLQGVLTCFRDAGIDPEIVTLDALLLPQPAVGAAFYLDGPRSLLATTNGVALSLDEVDTELVVESLDVASGADCALQCYPATGQSLLTANALASATGEGARVVVDTATAPLLPLLARDDLALRLRRAANLRQGTFARQSSGSLDPGFDWRPLAGIAAGWAVISLGYQVALGISHGRAADAVRDAEVALYRQLFPGVSQVPDPRRQMQGQISAVSGSENAFARLVAEASTVVAELDNGSGRYVTRSMAWDQAQGQLRMDMVARSLEELETLRQRLEARGLRVDIGSGMSQDGGYKARLNLEVGA